MTKTTRHGEFKYCSKSHSWQVISAVLAIISWFLCTIFYGDSMYRKRSAFMIYLKWGKIYTSNLARYKLIFIEEKSTILSTYFSIWWEFTLISGMSNIRLQWKKQTRIQNDSSLTVAFQLPRSNVQRRILVGCHLHAHAFTLKTSNISIARSYIKGFF